MSRTPSRSASVPGRRATNGTLIGLGLLLLALGLAGHLTAANVEGGHAIHYRDHIFGFVMLTLVCGIIVLLLGRRFWNDRRDITLLIVGLLQTILGWWVYVMFRGKV